MSRQIIRCHICRINVNSHFHDSTHKLIIFNFSTKQNIYQFLVFNERSTTVLTRACDSTKIWKIKRFIVLLFCFDKVFGIVYKVFNIDPIKKFKHHLRSHKTVGNFHLIFFMKRFTESI
jgi:hypothetical protein